MDTELTLLRLRCTYVSLFKELLNERYYGVSCDDDIEDKLHVLSSLIFILESTCELGDCDLKGKIPNLVEASECPQITINCNVLITEVTDLTCPSYNIIEI